MATDFSGFWIKMGNRLPRDNCIEKCGECIVHVEALQTGYDRIIAWFQELPA